MRMRNALLASVCLTFVVAANVDLSWPRAPPR